MCISFLKDEENIAIVRLSETLCLQEQRTLVEGDRRERIHRVLRGDDEVLDHFRDLTKIRVT